MIHVFTETQVKLLNEQQKDGSRHPYTCDKSGENCVGDGVLVAAIDGWHCPCGHYTQNWAYPSTEKSQFQPYADEQGISAEAYEYLFMNHFHFEDDLEAVVTLDQAMEAIRIDRKSR